MTAHDPNTRRASRIVRTIGVLRDLTVAATGVAVLVATPPSVGDSGASRTAVMVWALLPLVGGLVSLVGMVGGKPRAEMYGCSVVASAFLFWAGAAVVKPGATVVSLAVSGALVALALSAILRGVVVVSGLLPVSRGR